MLAWSFWFRRNKWIHDKKLIHSNESINRALSLSKSYKAKLPLTASQVRKTCTWTPPPPSFLKLNVECTLFFNNNKSRLGMILRDEARRTKLAGSIAWCIWTRIHRTSSHAKRTTNLHWDGYQEADFGKWLFVDDTRMSCPLSILTLK